MKAAALVGGVAVVLALFAPASAQAPAQIKRFQPSREWSFTEYYFDGTEDVLVAEPEEGEDRPIGGRLDEFFDYGPATVDFPPVDGIATGQIFSTASGVTYGVLAHTADLDLVDGFPDPNSPVGNKSDLEQYQNFRKDAPDATLRFTVTAVQIQAVDTNGSRFPRAPQCPAEDEHCLGTMEGEVILAVQAYPVDDPEPFFHTSGGARVFGWQGNFDFDVWTDSFSGRPLWGDEHFEFEPENGGPFLSHATLNLSAPKTFSVDLSSVGVGQEFTLRIDTHARAYNRRPNLTVEVSDIETFSTVSAFLRDPLEIGGAMLHTTGLTRTDDPVFDPAPLDPVAPVPCPSGTPDPVAGALQLSAPGYEIGEWEDAGQPVVVTRTGGSTGAVSATFATTDGTAVAGTDYTPVTTTVVFADGDTSSRLVTVPILQDAAAEPDETVNLALTEPGGCAVIGAESAATLTIVDDNRPIVADPAFTVGGTVTGLEGTGLALIHLSEQITPGNGPFTFTEPLPDGFPYDVRVATQPAEPLQICTVTNGSGTIAGADVTDVAVDCVTPPPTQGLDPAFGDEGKVTTDLNGKGARAVAIQPDGKIVTAGEFSLARYLPDGTPDPSFGDGGTVTTGLETGFVDDASDVAVQADGKIVVVGIADGGATDDDFGIECYLPNGTLDPSFDGDGRVTTDFNGGVDRAYGVAVQADTKIVVAGHAAEADGFGSDYAVARYLADGSLDPSFGVAGTGKVSTDAGVADVGHAVTLQPDGRIVVAGGLSDGGSGQNFGLVRYTTDGEPDTSFGALGIAIADFGFGSIADGVAVQPDGRIVATGLTGGDFAVARFEPDGDLDPTFSGDGMVTTDFGVLVFGRPALELARDLAIQADGRIVVVGTIELDRDADLAMARYLDDGTLDGTFGAGGLFTVDFFGSFDAANDVAIQADGKIVAAGSAVNGFRENYALVRVNP